MKSECQAITNKYPGAASVVQQVYKVLSDIENLAGWTVAKAEEFYCESHGGKHSKLVQSSRWETAF
jgi:hypothetical protein